MAHEAYVLLNIDLSAMGGHVSKNDAKASIKLYNEYVKVRYYWTNFNRNLNRHEMHFFEHQQKLHYFDNLMDFMKEFVYLDSIEDIVVVENH